MNHEYTKKIKNTHTHTEEQIIRFFLLASVYSFVSVESLTCLFAVEKRRNEKERKKKKIMMSKIADSFAKVQRRMGCM